MTTLRETLVQVVEALESYATCSDGCTCGDGWSHEPAASSLSAIHVQIEALDKAEPVGYLHIERFRGCKSMENANLDYVGDLPEGNYPLYTHPQSPKTLSDLLYSFAQDHAEQIGSAGKAEQVGELIAWIAGIERS